MLGGLIRGIYRPRTPRDPAQHAGAKVLMQGNGGRGVEILIGAARTAAASLPEAGRRGPVEQRRFLAILRLE